MRATEFGIAAQVRTWAAAYLQSERVPRSISATCSWRWGWAC
jgi:hypothetical protein